jgi:hypothetical protein
MAQAIEQEADLLPYGGGRILFGQNLKILVYFPIGGAPVILENGGVDDNNETSPLIAEGGENNTLQPDPIQHDSGEDTV